MRDPKTEAFLDRGQWSWRYEEIITSEQIDLVYSANNPARLDRKIDEERALQYAEEMQDGVQFPAIVLVTPSDRGVLPFDVATGMHRLRAADYAQAAKPYKIDAYVVTEADRYRRDVLTRQLNTIEGRGVDAREQIMHVLHLHDLYKQPLALLCKEWHLKEHTVRVYFRAENCKRRAREQGFDLSRVKLSATSLGKIDTSVHSDKVFNEVIKFVVYHGPPANMIEDVCRQIRDIRDEAQALGVINDLMHAEEEKREKERAKTARTRAEPAQTMISNVQRFNRHASRGVDQLFLAMLGDANRGKARALVEDMIAHAKLILTELERIDRVAAVKHAAD